MRTSPLFSFVLVALVVACGGSSDASVFPCTAAGIRAAIVAGGGPHTFSCDGPKTVVTKAEITIENDVILDGEGNFTLDGNEAHRVFSVPENVTAELRGFTVTKGCVGGVNCVGGAEARVDAGGGILNEGTLTLRNSTVSGNQTARQGGGIYSTGTVELANSTVSGNQAVSFGGGIYLWGGTVELRNSTVSGNTTTLGGGGIHSDSGRLILTDSTVSGNTALNGGGIGNGAGGTLTLTNSTVSGNTASADGGGIFNRDGTAALTNSTVSGNTAEHANGIIGAVTLTNSLLEGDCFDADIVSNGHNIESPSNTCGFNELTDQVNVSADDLKLGPLQDNGGPTETHALGAGSVAIDQISEAECVDADGEPLATDQRGEPRDSTCDVGAFEVQP